MARWLEIHSKNIAETHLVNLDTVNCITTMPSGKTVISFVASDKSIEVYGYEELKDEILRFNIQQKERK